MSETAWQLCLNHFEHTLSRQEFNTWLRPLQADWRSDGLYLLAPNDFVLKWVGDHYFSEICKHIKQHLPESSPQVRLVVGSKPVQSQTQDSVALPSTDSAGSDHVSLAQQAQLNTQFTFENFVTGGSNELAVAAAMQVGQGAAVGYNPLMIYGGVGLGKTHLMHAIGRKILDEDPGKNVRYLHAERFVTDMVKALRRNQMDQFKSSYRQVDVLLVDDIQFFAGKERSQEEFFHTFNALMDARQQIVLTSDCFPKELEGLEDRLKSRFSWGLAISIDPPELETRVAILMQKAHQSKVNLPQEVAFFIAQHVRANVRELEGALKRVIANAHFTGQAITLNFTRQALSDMLVVHAKTTQIENIQKVVAQFYGLQVSDFAAKRRTRSVAWPRQMAMYLAREFSSKSLPEIGAAFGGRDHTTVLYACRKVKEKLDVCINSKEEYEALLKILSI
ncbi:MAG: chromosomal replication initiator protein DnaA [Legionellales bacterium]|nr:chromosomal replication initiator protein DnaA [Legionellales bacterium]